MSELGLPELVELFEQQNLVRMFDFSQAKFIIVDIIDNHHDQSNFPTDEFLLILENVDTKRRVCVTSSKIEKYSGS